MNPSKGFNSALKSIGRSLEKEYTTDGGKANMQLVILLAIFFALTATTELPEYITNFFLVYIGKPQIDFLPSWMLPTLLASFILVGIWCVSRISKIEKTRKKRKS